ALDDRAHDVREVRLIMAVQLLERAAGELGGRNVGGDRKECGGVRLRHRQRHDQIRRPRAARGECRDGLVFDAEIGVRHVPGGLLVPWRDELHLVADVVELIEQAHIAVAADPEHIGDFLPYQKLRDEFCALLPRHWSLLFPVVLPDRVLPVVPPTAGRATACRETNSRPEEPDLHERWSAARVHYLKTTFKRLKLKLLMLTFVTAGERMVNCNLW